MRPLTSTLRFSGILLSSSVSRNSDSIINSGSTARDFGSITRRISSADSSRTPPTSGSFFSLSSSAIFSTSRDFCTSQGISVMTTIQVARAHSSDRLQVLLVVQLVDLLHQPRLLHQPGDFGDDHDPGTAGALFLAPAGA